MGERYFFGYITDAVPGSWMWKLHPLCNYYFSIDESKLKLIELLSHDSNRQNNCIKTNLNIAKVLLIQSIANGQR